MKIARSRLFVVHGWGGSPNGDWLPWLKESLKDYNVDVTMLSMPDTNKPEMNAWIKHLSSVVGEPDSNTYFVGHSIGCQTIMRYIADLPESTKIGGIVFVAGWMTLTGLETEEEKAIAQPWLEKEINLKAIKHHANNILAIFSDNDPFVPFQENKTIFRRMMGAKIICVHEKGHICTSDGITKLDEILDAVLYLME